MERGPLAIDMDDGHIGRSLLVDDLPCDGFRGHVTQLCTLLGCLYQADALGLPLDMRGKLLGIHHVRRQRVHLIEHGLGLVDLLVQVRLFLGQSASLLLLGQYLVLQLVDLLLEFLGGLVRLGGCTRPPALGDEVVDLLELLLEGWRNADAVAALKRVQHGLKRYLLLLQ